jgi:hypothetical protein
MDPVKQGQRAAWTLFAKLLGVYVVVALLVYGVMDSSCRAQGSCVLVILERMVVVAVIAVVIGFAGLLAALSKSQELPPESRKAFWLTGLLCMALSGFLWFSICRGIGWVMWIRFR